MRNCKKNICALMLVALVATGCELLHQDRVVARVGDAALHESALVEATAGLTGEDSTKVADKFVEQWVRSQVKIMEAERVLASSKGEIDRLVEEYRTSLMNNRLDQQYLTGRMDTLITDSMVRRYFDSHRSDFVMDRAVVKGRIVRLPDDYRQSVKLFKLMGSKSEDSQQDFLDLCAKNNFELHTFDNWVDFNEFLSYLPVRRDKNYDYLLSGDKIREMADVDSKYFIEISDVIKQGADAPYERVADRVRRILFNQRRAELVGFYNDSLYNAALVEGIITIENID